MKRREVVAVLGAVAVAPFAALGQQRKLRTIGYLSSNPPDVPVGEVAAFRQGLGEAGVVEGRDAAIEYRFAEGKYDRLTRFAAELVTHNVDVIAASGLPAAVAAKSATAKIPIVFTVGVDPVAQGLVESLNRPGGNLTGVTQLVGTLAAKQLELLHEVAPNASAIGFLINPTNPDAATLSKIVGVAAENLGVRIIPLSARRSGRSRDRSCRRSRKGDGRAVVQRRCVSSHPGPPADPGGRPLWHPHHVR